MLADLWLVGSATLGFFPVDPQHLITTSKSLFQACVYAITGLLLLLFVCFIIIITYPDISSLNFLFVLFSQGSFVACLPQTIPPKTAQRFCGENTRKHCSVLVAQVERFETLANGAWWHLANGAWWYLANGAWWHLANGAWWYLANDAWWHLANGAWWYLANDAWWHLANCMWWYLANGVWWYLANDVWWYLARWQRQQRVLVFCCYCFFLLLG